MVRSSALSSGHLYPDPSSAVWTDTQKVLFTETNSALKAQSLKKTLQDLKISLSLGQSYAYQVL